MGTLKGDFVLTDVVDGAHQFLTGGYWSPGFVGHSSGKVRHSITPMKLVLALGFWPIFRVSGLPTQHNVSGSFDETSRKSQALRHG